MMQSRKKVALIIITIFLVLSGVGLFAFLTRKTATLNIKVAPATASIIINGKSYSNYSSEKFTPGTYSVTISNEGFASKTISLNLEDNTTKDLYLYLKSDENDFAYYETNYDDLYFLREYLTHDVADDEVREFLRDYDKRYAIKNVIPLSDIDPKTGDYYYIFFKEGLAECKRLYCLEVGASTTEYSKKALQQIEKLGFDPEKYQIIYSIGDKG